MITKTRHWLFHSTSEQPPDFGKLIASMGSVLRTLAGIRKCVEEGVSWDSVHSTSEAKIVWKWDNYRHGITRPLFVQLRLNERMSIPLDENKMFTGRANELKTTVDAVLSLETTNRRILIHGPPGMGKDTLAVQAVRHDRVENRNPGFELQGWLQGSTSTALTEQLIKLFQVHRREVLPNESLNAKDNEKLDVIRAWLSGHSNWLIVVEDATLEAWRVRDYLWRWQAKTCSSRVRSVLVCFERTK